MSWAQPQQSTASSKSKCWDKAKNSKGSTAAAVLVANWEVLVFKVSVQGTASRSSTLLLPCWLSISPGFVNVHWYLSEQKLHRWTISVSCWIESGNEVILGGKKRLITNNTIWFLFPVLIYEQFQHAVSSDRFWFMALHTLYSSCRIHSLGINHTSSANIFVDVFTLITVFCAAFVFFKTIKR